MKSETRCRDVVGIFCEGMFITFALDCGRRGRYIVEAVSLPFSKRCTAWNVIIFFPNIDLLLLSGCESDDRITHTPFMPSPDI